MRTNVVAMTYDELMKTIEWVREQLAKQDWALRDYPQIDREKVIREINERMTRYATEPEKYFQNRSAYAEEGSKDEESTRTTN